jgi:uncharacterized protein (DUF1697 family)
VTTWVTLLRAVNLGPHGRLVMAEFRAFLTGLGFEGVRTVVQTGNAVFDAPGEGGALEKRMEAEAEKQLGLKTAFIVRTADEWRKLVAANPYPRQAADDPAHTVLMALRSEPAAGGLETLRQAIKGPEIVELVGRDAHLHYPVDIGHSKVTSALVERKLGVTGTARNWNTVLKIAALLGD